MQNTAEEQLNTAIVPVGEAESVVIAGRGADDLCDSANDAAVGCVSKANAGAPAGAMTNEEAAEKLRGANSGLKPSLLRRGYRFMKRICDIVASGAAIILLLVPGLILSVVICVKSPGASPLYSQLRVGRLRKDGAYRLFRMWKFRSMVPRADEMLSCLCDRNEADGPLFKIKDDPRIIPGIGTFIRKHSIDELPQLLNVFVGQIPSRILKTRQGFSLKKPGAFALPAILARTRIAASLQVRAVICAVAGVPQNLFEYFIAGYGEMREVFAKRGSRIGFPLLGRFKPVPCNGFPI